MRAHTSRDLQRDITAVALTAPGGQFTVGLFDERDQRFTGQTFTVATREAAVAKCDELIGFK